MNLVFILAAAEEFGAPLPAIADACALLDPYGVFEFSGGGEARAARIATGIR